MITVTYLTYKGDKRETEVREGLLQVLLNSLIDCDCEILRVDW